MIMKRVLTATALATVLAASVIFAGPSLAGPGHGGSGGGWSGGGWSTMMGSGMGPGMMGGGVGPGRMMGYGGPSGMPGNGVAPCPGYGAANAGDLDLTADGVKKNLEQQLAWHGNDRLQVGEIKKDGDNFVADIVTKDNALVERLQIDGKTGFSKRIN
jgi:hypothetical protein